MCTGQTLFPLEIEPDIPRVRPWKEVLAAGAQATWLSTRHKSHPLQELQPTKTIDNPEIKTWLALGTCGGKKKKGKKEDKAKAEPGDSTNGATPQE
ncbi:ERBB-3 BINDING PROTEIN [Trifolium repens]|nr:ERBB-3 BINDING PROTEIN [Trifolium repens]